MLSFLCMIVRHDDFTKMYRVFVSFSSGNSVKTKVTVLTDYLHISNVINSLLKLDKIIYHTCRRRVVQGLPEFRMYFPDFSMHCARRVILNWLTFNSILFYLPLEPSLCFREDRGLQSPLSDTCALSSVYMSVGP